MYAKFCVNRETASNFMRLFVNRRAYAIQAERPLPNGSVPYYPARDWKTKEPKPLDDGVVRMHLNGDITISLYAINPETQRSKWVAIDADFDGASGVAVSTAMGTEAGRSGRRIGTIAPRRASLDLRRRATAGFRMPDLCL